MLKILLIRRNVHDNVVLRNILLTLPVILYDVFKREFITVKHICSSGEVQVTFRGLDIMEFDKAIFLNTPMPDSPTESDLFAFCEFEATLLAILQISNVPLLNRPLAISCNRTQLNAIPFCKYWSSIGWKVPLITSAFSRNNDQLNLHKQLEPDPHKNICHQLYITSFSYWIFPKFAPKDSRLNVLIHLIEQTQKHMWDIGCDFISFHFFNIETDYYIYDTVRDIPFNTNKQRLSQLIYKTLL